MAKRKPIKWDNMHDAGVIMRDALWGQHTSAHGRSTMWADCPFCGAEVIAYTWSLAGGGKRCGMCGALLGWGPSIQWADLPNIEPTDEHNERMPSRACGPEKP